MTLQREKLTVLQRENRRLRAEVERLQKVRAALLLRLAKARAAERKALEANQQYVSEWWSRRVVK